RFMEGGYGPHQISAGSGIFFGIHGQQTAVQAVTATRRASMTEDPSLRRSIGGGYLIHTFHVAPSFPPALTAFPDGSPAVFHDSFLPVTASNPARAGEQLIVQAVNLGFTTPAVNPGVAFSNSPYNVITGPVDAVLSGQALETRNQLGWPTLVNTYRVDFTVPN